MNKKILLIIGVIIAIALAAWKLPLGNYIEQALSWVESHQKIAWIVFSLLYITAIVFILPASVFSLAAGYLFGLFQGWSIVVVTATIGSILAFIVGRSLLRNWVVEKAAEMKNFNSLDEAVSQKGLFIVFLTRLSPVFPFSLINYVYGITKISLRNFSLATFFGIMPGSLLYVYAGSTAKNLQDVLSGNVEFSGAQQYLLYGGLVATLIVTIVITRIASKALKENSKIEIETKT